LGINAHAMQVVRLSPRMAPQPVEEIISVGVVVEDLPPLDAAHDNVMQRSRAV
jgi:hypothetical protein